jgi:uncharacterized membrane protein
MITFLLSVGVLAGLVMLRRLRQDVEATQADLRAVAAKVEVLRRPTDAAVEPVAEVAVPPVEAAPALPPAVPRPAPAPETPIFDFPPAAAPASSTEQPPPPPPVEAVAKPARPPVAIDWERWIGVRGAAVLGGIVLALAAILFLKYSIEHGLIPPAVRVALGFLAGGASIIGSEVLRRRRYGATADAVAGAGVVILYAAVWAARVLYTLVPGPVAWLLMVLVTLVCGLLSWRRESLVIALLGLVGGFLTPLLLATGAVDPIGLFGYVLLLDGGLVWLASRRRWPLLVDLSLGATFLYQAVWVFARMTPARFPLTLGILAVFAVVYAFVGSRRGAESPPGYLERGGRAGGILSPFLFALYFAARADLGPRLWPLAVLLMLLSLLATWVGRARREEMLPAAVALADCGVLAVWVVRGRLETAAAWELAAVALALACAFHWPMELGSLKLGPPERDRGRDGSAPAWRPATVATGGLALLVVFARLDSTAPAVFWPWLAGWAALTALWLRQAAIAAQPRLRLVAAVLPAIAFAVFAPSHASGAAMPSGTLYLGLMVAAAVAFQLLGLRARGAAAEKIVDRPDAAPLLAAVGLALALLLILDLPSFATGAVLATSIALGLLGILAATRLTSGLAYLWVAALMVVSHFALAFGRGRFAGGTGDAKIILAAGAAAVLLVTSWPFLAGRRLAADRWALYAAALAGPAWFLVLQWAWRRQFGAAAIAVLPVALGALSLAAALRGRRAFAADDPARKRSLVWFLAVALGFVSLAIPMQLRKEWITIGWALQGAGVMALWERLDHPGLRSFGLALLAAVSVRLVANPALLGYYPHGGLPVFNWLMYTYLVPAAALLWSARIQERVETGRGREVPTQFGGAGLRGAGVCGASAILVVFVWINLTIFDAFSRGGGLAVTLHRLPARDLTLSLAWTLYAVLLLAIGMARRSVALRWLSLAFLILAIAKVFLYDLGELHDLYRVASLVGLAISLLVVSLAYQRFVFAADREAAAGPSEEP